MHLRIQHVEDANAIAASNQRVRDMRADESCSAGDQHVWHGAPACNLYSTDVNTTRV
jgi:hypothetical protein